jgi:hypothetical protein
VCGGFSGAVITYRISDFKLRKVQLFEFLRNKKSGVIVVTLNAKLQPTHRHELEDAFTEVCNQKGTKVDVVGGGTLLEDDGEVKSCDIEVELADRSDINIASVREVLERMLAPKGSYLTVPDEDRRIEFGKHEGLGLYLNGTDLPDEVYENGDSNYVYSECERLIEDLGMVNSHWQGPTETALYMYGTSFEVMSNAIKPFVDSYPLCQKARIVRLA